MREHYEGKIQQLTNQTKAADAKAMQLFEQYTTLLKTLDEKEKERTTLLEQIKEANQEIKVGKEDMDILRLFSFLLSFFFLFLSFSSYTFYLTPRKEYENELRRTVAVIIGPHFRARRKTDENRGGFWSREIVQSGVRKMQGVEHGGVAHYGREGRAEVCER